MLSVSIPSTSTSTIWDVRTPKSWHIGLANLICRTEPNKNTNEETKNKNRDAQKKRTSHKAVESVLNNICPYNQRTADKLACVIKVVDAGLMMFFTSSKHVYLVLQPESDPTGILSQPLASENYSLLAIVRRR